MNEKIITQSEVEADEAQTESPSEERGHEDYEHGEPWFFDQGEEPE